MRYGPAYATGLLCVVLAGLVSACYHPRPRTPPVSNICDELLVEGTSNRLVYAIYSAPVGGRDVTSIWLCPWHNICAPLISHNTEKPIVAMWSGPKDLRIRTESESLTRYRVARNYDQYIDSYTVEHVRKIGDPANPALTEVILTRPDGGCEWVDDFSGRRLKYD